MDAMIFAAGLGTRLGEIGRSAPKALLEVGGATMLEHVCGRLVAAGVDRIVVNVHHHAERIEAFVRTHDLGAEVLISREAERPLETGGGLVHARPLLRGDGPIFLHNVDVLTEADLRGMYAATVGSRALAVLAVNERPTSRHLLFDQDGLFGRLDARNGTRIESRVPRGTIRAWAFAGVHVIAPELLDRITETGVFSILEPYLRLAGEGHRILPHPLGDALWLEVGTVERLETARRLLDASVRTAGTASAPNQETGP
jgi:MurNAc alpha-1-phosphate uridylyltransferase